MTIITDGIIQYLKINKPKGLKVAKEDQIAHMSYG